MTQPAVTEQQTTLYCYKHPDRETLLRCGKCDRPICTKCLVRHPVGIRCQECAQVRKDPLTNLTPTQYGLAFVCALTGGIIGGFIAPFLGILFAFFIGPAIGAAIAEFVRRVIGYKRGLVLQIIVGVCIVLGVIMAQTLALWLPLLNPEAATERLPARVVNASTLIQLAIASVLRNIVYIIFAIGGALARLR
jgi:hypothetical protein